MVFLEVAGGLRERVEVVCGAFFVFVSTLLRYVVHTLFFCSVTAGASQLFVLRYWFLYLQK